MIGVFLMTMLGLGDVGVSIDDLPAYKSALETTANEAQEVSFRELWDRPEFYRGKRVEIRGTIVRTFRTGAVGELPARVELWIVTKSGDFICAVCRDEGADPLPTSEIAFRGISLGKITYAAGDVPRIAPLIVGPHGPTKSDPLGKTSVRAPWFVAGDLLFYMIVAAAVLMLMIRVQLRKPPRRRPEPEVRVEFVDSPPAEFDPEGFPHGS